MREIYKLNYNFSQIKTTCLQLTEHLIWRRGWYALKYVLKSQLSS